MVERSSLFDETKAMFSVGRYFFRVILNFSPNAILGKRLIEENLIYAAS